MKTEIGLLKSETSIKPAASKQKRYDLEQRTLTFAKDVRHFTTRLPRTIANNEDSKQVIRSSGSVGANYLEANESLSKKDFLMRIKIAKKEARETVYWLEIINAETSLINEKQSLLKEATELTNILGAILRNSA